MPPAWPNGNRVPRTGARRQRFLDGRLHKIESHGTGPGSAERGSRGDAMRLSMAIVFGALVTADLLAGARASAEERIGNTAISRNVVQRLSSATASPIKTGDDVFANESVKTGVESAAKFVFSDETNLAMGAASTVKLDRFVYRGDTTYSKAAVNFAAGAFRFTTGGSDKRAYELKTNTATIGVRGTVFDVRVAGGQTTVTLVEGDIVLCPRGRFDGDPRTLSAAQQKRYDCKELKQPGDTATVQSRSAKLGGPPVDFAAGNCSGDGGLCTASTYAVNENSPGLCYLKPDAE